MNITQYIIRLLSKSDNSRYVINCRATNRKHNSYLYRKTITDKLKALNKKNTPILDSLIIEFVCIVIAVIITLCLNET